MSLGACIPDLLAKGEIDAGQAEEMTRLFGLYQRHYAKDGAAADALASEAVMAKLEADEAERWRRELLQVRAQQEAWLAMQSYGTGAGGLRALDPDRPGHLAEAAFGLFGRREHAPYRNFEHLERAVRGRAHGIVRGVLEKHHRDILGRVRDKAGAEDLLREARGENTGNADARELAGAWLKAADYLRRRANRAGARIGKLDDWGVPQAHDSQAVSDAGFDRWFADIRDELDRGKIGDRETGLPLDDAAFEALMRDVFDSIASEGLARSEPGKIRELPLGERMGAERVLHFRDADAWLRYADKYGSRDGVFDAMMVHLKLMSRDIALMELFGPDPSATVRWLGDTIRKQSRLDGRRKHREAADAAIGKLERLYDTARGATQYPEHAALARWGGAIRSWQVATKLGSAVLSTTSDQATQAIARKFNGLPVARQFGTQLRLLDPGNAEDRALAMRMMLVAEEMSNMASSQARLTGEEITGEVSRRLAETTLRLSGLSAVTQASRWAFGMDFWAAASSWRDRSWAQLDPPFRSMFERHGLGERHWQAIREAKLHEERGTTWVLPENIDAEGLADDIVQMVLREMDMAVPVAGLELRAAIEGAAPKGSIVGEVIRTGFQFKAFPATILMQQWRRSMALQSGWSRAKYAAQIGIATTLAGALAMQLKEISKGRDPRDMWPDDAGGRAKFWGSAVIQGGGLGIFGDFLANSTNRFGGGIAGTLAGPAFQTGDTLMQLATGEAFKTARGEDANFGRAAMKLIKSETPVIGSLFYTRLAYERLMLDTLQEAIDPQSRQSFRALENYAQRQGNDYFWEPGAGLDEARAPDVGSALGN